MEAARVAHARRRSRRRPQWLPTAVVVTAAALGAVLVASFLHSTQHRTVRQSIDHWARVYGVDVHLARAVAWEESGNNPRALSSAGARGVMQVTPDTWRYTESLLGGRIGRTSDGNIRIGIAYLHYLMGEFDGNLRLALAAYHQGPAAVRAHGVYPSSARYVSNILALRRRL